MSSVTQRIIPFWALRLMCDFCSKGRGKPAFALSVAILIQRTVEKHAIQGDHLGIGQARFFFILESELAEGWRERKREDRNIRNGTVQGYRFIETHRTKISSIWICLNVWRNGMIALLLWIFPHSLLSTGKLMETGQTSIYQIHHLRPQTVGGFKTCFEEQSQTHWESIKNP